MATKIRHAGIESGGRYSGLKKSPPFQWPARPKVTPAVAAAQRNIVSRWIDIQAWRLVRMPAG
jgi:hypothetical protein